MERNDVPVERKREREKREGERLRSYTYGEKEKGGQSSLGEMFVLEPM